MARKHTQLSPIRSRSDDPHAIGRIVISRLTVVVDLRSHGLRIVLNLLLPVRRREWPHGGVPPATHGAAPQNPIRSMFYAAAIRANRVGADSPWMTRRGAPLAAQGRSAAEDEHGEKLVELRSSVCRIGAWGSFLASPRFFRDARRGPIDAHQQERRRRLNISLCPHVRQWWRRLGAQSNRGIEGAVE
jgi:hypothetical protein